MICHRPYAEFESFESEKTYLEVYPEVIASNYRKLMQAIPSGVAGFSVVKADAYGHTNAICAPALYGAGCRHFAVSSVSEAVALRSILSPLGDALILILGHTPPVLADKLSEYGITQCVYSLDYAKKLSANAKSPISVHIKLNTGMNRIGFEANRVEDADATAKEILQVAACKNLKITGMFTHFAKADAFTAEGDAFTKAQYERFLAVDKVLKENGLDVGFRHVCNSAGSLRFPAYALDAVRFGIILYGGGDERLSQYADTKPVMKLCTVVSHLQTLRKGESVGYGGTFTAQKDLQLATLPIGYADGWIRAYRGSAITLCTKSGPHRANLVGRICMDQCMADVDGLDVAPGDRVVLFGEDRHDLDALAAAADTIDYECLCILSSRIPRIPKSSAER